MRKPILVPYWSTWNYSIRIVSDQRSRLTRQSGLLFVNGGTVRPRASTGFRVSTACKAYRAKGECWAHDTGTFSPPAWDRGPRHHPLHVAFSCAVLPCVNPGSSFLSLQGALCPFDWPRSALVRGTLCRNVPEIIGAVAALPRIDDHKAYEPGR